MRKGAGSAKRTFCAVLLAVCIAVNIAACRVIDYAYHVDSDAVNEVIAINKYFENDDLSEIMYLYYGAPEKLYDKFGRLMDTYIERRHNFYCVEDKTLMEQMKDGRARISDIKFPGKYSRVKAEYRDVNAINYIIQENQNSLGQRRLMNVEIVPELSGKHFTVYKNLNPSVIQFEN